MDNHKTNRVNDAAAKHDAPAEPMALADDELDKVAGGSMIELLVSGAMAAGLGQPKPLPTSPTGGSLLGAKSPTRATGVE